MNRQTRELNKKGIQGNIIWYTAMTNLSHIFDGITTIKMSKNKSYIDIGCGFDIETSNINKEYSFPYIWQFSLGDKIFLCRDCKAFKNFTNRLSNQVYKTYGKNVILQVFDANISFEYSFYKDVLNITDVRAKTKRNIMSFVVSENLKFVEVLGVFGESLEKISKNFCKTQKLKGDLNYNLIRSENTPLTTKELMYCINDVVILSELWQYAKNTYLEKGKEIPSTQTGIVRSEIKDKLSFFDKKKVIKENATYTDNQKLYDCIRQWAFSGGYTHSNAEYVGKVQNRKCTEIKYKGITFHTGENAVECFDLTSAYPWAISTRNFPAGRMIPTSTHNGTLDDLKQYRHYIAKLAIHRINAKTTHSLLSKHKIPYIEHAVWDNGRLLEGINLIIWVNEIDLENITALYNIDGCIVIGALTFTKSTACPAFVRDTMLDFYKQKQVLKQKGLSKTIEYMTAKQKVNSCYGMLCTQIYESEIIYENGELHQIGADWNKNKNTIFNCNIGYWCTAYVRNRLIDVISKYPAAVVQYDTDSLYVKTDYTDCIKYIESINDKITAENETIFQDEYECCRDLGLWDSDGKYIQFCGYGAKRYHGEYDFKTVWKKCKKAYNKTPFELISENNLVDLYKCMYNFTWAGAKKSDVFKDSISKNQQLFDYLQNFEIGDDITSKLVGKYYDNSNETHTLYDYKGNKFTTAWISGTILYNATFSSTLSDELKNTFERKRIFDYEYTENK